MSSSTTGVRFTALRRATGARTTLFCFPSAGAGASLFRSWRDRFAETVELVAVSLPGREARHREPSFDRMETLVAGVVASLEPFIAEPYAFFGHSFGALVAFETARAIGIRRKIAAPTHVFACARNGPRCPRTRPTLHGCSDGRLAGWVRSLGYTPPEVLDDAELRPLVLAPLRADLALIESYRCAQQPRLNVPLIALAGDDDPETSAAGVAAWELETDASFKVRNYPGGHFFPFQEPGAVLDDVAHIVLSGAGCALREGRHGTDAA